MPQTHHNRKPFGERLIQSNWRWLLFPLWLLYRPIIGLRNQAYDCGLLNGKRLSKPVISVGNIIAGGSGKTPVVAYLCQLLQTDYQVHVLSRGYKKDGEHNEEASLIAAPVHSHHKRFIAGQSAIKAGANLLVLDDGFQHRQLARDCDIVLIDATRPWGFPGLTPGAVLPLGFLRESRRALKRADLLLVTRSDQVSEQLRKHLLQLLRRLHKPVLCSQHAPACLRTLDGTSHDCTILAGKQVICISGIAHPQSFVDSARGLGYDICERFDYPDHHHFTSAEIQQWLERAQERNACILCTSKDAVKLQRLWPADAQIPCYILEVKLQLNTDDEKELLSCIQRHLGAAAQ